MRREFVLGGALVVLVASVAGAVVLFPGVVADDSGDQREGFVRLTEIAIGDGAVGGETVELVTDIRLENRRGVSENVSVELRAVGSDSGLVETSHTVDLGRLSDEGEVSVVRNLTVERGGDYRIEAVVYQDGQRRDSGDRTVRGTGALVPAYAQTSVAFHRFAGYELPVIEYSIESVRDNRTTLNVSSYLTNTGEESSDDVRLVLKARQADSNIVADETTITVGDIAPGTTVTPTATLSVPAGYNYYLDGILYKNGVIVATARAGASLSPTETVDVNSTQREIGLQIGEFERSRDSPPRDTDEPTETPSESGPGFGVGLGVVAILLGLLVRARGGNQ